MKISLKNALAIALAGASALSAVSASADVALPGSGNGELTLFVRNDVTGDVYARGLQVFVDDVLTQAEIVANAGPTAAPVSYNYILPTIAPDANLTSFLGQAGTFTWTVMAGDNTQLVALGDKRYLTTTPGEVANAPTNGTLASQYNNLQQTLITLNGILPDAGGSSTLTDGQWRQDGAVPGVGAGNWWSGTGPNNVNELGAAANFYLFTTGTPTRTFQLADVTLSADGTLSAVPLPAAVWLLGSGLIGLAGVGRRRKQV